MIVVVIIMVMVGSPVLITVFVMTRTMSIVRVVLGVMLVMMFLVGCLDD